MAIEKELAEFKESGKKRTVETLEQARTLTTTITIIGFAVLGAVRIGVAVLSFCAPGFIPAGALRQVEFVRVIGTAHHRPAGHMDKTQLRARRPVCIKFARRNKFHHRQMLHGGLQILSQGQHVAPGRGANHRIASQTSASVSPKPSIMPDLV